MELVLVPLGGVAVGILIALLAEGRREGDDEPNEEHWPYVGKHRHIEGR